VRWIPGSLRRTAKLGLRRLSAVPAFRRGALSLVRSMNRRTFRALRAHRGVADVYVRGSFVRGPFVPLASDVDLVLLLRDEAGRSYAAVADVHRCLRRARRTNISIRDWWQHMILEAERPLVGAFWPLFGAEEWRGEDGRLPIACDGRTDGRELSWALWSQLCLWSGSVFHAYLRPAGRVHDLDAGLKKSLQLSSLLSRLAQQRGPLDPDTLAALKKDEAERLTAGFRPCGREPAARRAALRRVYRALESGAAALDVPGEGEGTAAAAGRTGRLSAPLSHVIRSQHATVIVFEDGLDDAALDDAFDRLDRTLAGLRVTFVAPACAARLFPFPMDDLTIAGGGPYAAPRVRAPERYLFETLFLPSLARVSVVFPDRGDRLARTALALLRAVLLYGDGTFATSATEARRIVLQRPDILRRVPGLEPWIVRSSRQAAAPDAVFDLCTRLTDLLHPLLLAYAARRPAAEAGAR